MKNNKALLVIGLFVLCCTTSCDTWYRDADGDGFGNPADSIQSDTEIIGYVVNNFDCDDDNPNVNPDVREIPDNVIDENCDGKIDKSWYKDSDADGFGNSTAIVLSDVQPSGYVSNSLDCDDTNADIQPNATEIPGNDLDENCDNITEESFDQVTDSFGMTFNLIPAGTFMMGSPEDEPGRIDNETLHEVTLTENFYMQTTELTQGQWRAVITRAEEEGILDPGDLNANPAYFKDCGDTCPVEQVSWKDIQLFVCALNRFSEGTYHLPTEAQWEYAARSGSTAAFANGVITGYDPNNTNDMFVSLIGFNFLYDANLDKMGWYSHNTGATISNLFAALMTWQGEEKTASFLTGDEDLAMHRSHTFTPGRSRPVALKNANSWGLHDMHGNVGEWCQDWYGYFWSDSEIDPAGPSRGQFRVFRGGTWLNTAEYCRSAFRGYWTPELRVPLIGFRLALTVQPDTHVTENSMDNVDMDEGKCTIHPDEKDLPDNGIEQDVSAETEPLWYEDSDSDGFGNPSISVMLERQPDGYVSNKGDCDDSRADVNPDAVEISGNDTDENCDGIIEESRATVENSFGMTFSHIPAGTFIMGSSEDDPDMLVEEIPHEVRLSRDFYMQTTELTQGQWRAVVSRAEEKGILDPGDVNANPAYFNDCGDNCPVEQVSWDDVQVFVNALNRLGEGTYSLPTEAQWEYAARAGSLTSYANGVITEYDMKNRLYMLHLDDIMYGFNCLYNTNLDKMGWYCHNSDAMLTPYQFTPGRLHPVGLKSANAWGLYDMHGNVWEWCQDYYWLDPSHMLLDQTDPPSDALTDPMESSPDPEVGDHRRVLRGGSWLNTAEFCRSTSRSNGPPDLRILFVGFRLVLHKDMDSTL